MQIPYDTIVRIRASSFITFAKYSSKTALSLLNFLLQEMGKKNNSNIKDQ